MKELLLPKKEVLFTYDMTTHRSLSKVIKKGNVVHQLSSGQSNHNHKEEPVQPHHCEIRGERGECIIEYRETKMVNKLSICILY